MRLFRLLSPALITIRDLRASVLILTRTRWAQHYKHTSQHDMTIEIWTSQFFSAIRVSTIIEAFSFMGHTELH